MAERVVADKSSAKVGLAPSKSVRAKGATPGGPIKRRIGSEEHVDTDVTKEPSAPGAPRLRPPGGPSAPDALFKVDRPEAGAPSAPAPTPLPTAPAAPPEAIEPGRSTFAESQPETETGRFFQLLEQYQQQLGDKGARAPEPAAPVDTTAAEKRIEQAKAGASEDISEQAAQTQEQIDEAKRAADEENQQKVAGLAEQQEKIGEAETQVLGQRSNLQTLLAESENAQAQNKRLYDEFIRGETEKAEAFERERQRVLEEARRANEERNRRIEEALNRQREQEEQRRREYEDARRDLERQASKAREAARSANSSSRRRDDDRDRDRDRDRNRKSSSRKVTRTRSGGRITKRYS
jgi:hypothetical protein